MKLANLALGASLFTAGIFTAPAMAASLTNATIGGAGDVWFYDYSNGQTFKNNAASLDSLLQGDASNPMGNVELFPTSETTDFSTAKATSLSGNLNGTSIVLESLTASDWDDFGQDWFSEFLDAALKGGNPGEFITTMLYTQFVINGGREIFSDPNISYVNQDDVTGEVKIGLAGHLNARDRILAKLPEFVPGFVPGTKIKVAELFKDKVQASEIVKVTYGEGMAEYFWSFNATASGLTEKSDGVSHSGNYEVSFRGDLPPAQSVPEPASVISLLALGGLGVAAKRKVNA